MASFFNLKAEIEYEVIEITLNSIEEYIEPKFINDNGQVAGDAGDSAFLWSPEGDSFFISLHGAFRYEPSYSSELIIAGLNDSGSIVGTLHSYCDDEEEEEVFIWDQKEGLRYPILDDSTHLSKALGINNSGQVLCTLDERLFIWHDLEDIVEVDFPNSYFPVGIDENSHLLFAQQNSGPLLFPEGTFCFWDSHLRNFIFPKELWLFPQTFNPKGDVAGMMRVERIDGMKTYFWTWSQEKNSCEYFSPVETENEKWITINAMNDRNEIVGVFEQETDEDLDEENAFIWSEENGMRNLNDLINPTLGWELISANAINNRGEIVGIGFKNGFEKAFFARPLY